MNEEKIKELLSHGYVRLLANRNGYICHTPQADYGVDLTIGEIKQTGRTTGSRFLETGRLLSIQLKSTCESSVSLRNGFLHYDLESKTHNDLIDRWSSPSAAPMWLVLLVLPDDKAEWVRLNEAELSVRRLAYYWRPPDGASRTANSRTVRIAIPCTQTLGMSFFQDRYVEYWGNAA